MPDAQAYLRIRIAHPDAPRKKAELIRRVAYWQPRVRASAEFACQGGRWRLLSRPAMRYRAAPGHGWDML